jgi:hypothetical protein
MHCSEVEPQKGCEVRIICAKGDRCFRSGADNSTPSLGEFRLRREPLHFLLSQDALVSLSGQAKRSVGKAVGEARSWNGRLFRW